MFEVIFAIPVTVIFFLIGPPHLGHEVFSSSWLTDICLLLLSKVLLLASINLTLDLERTSNQLVSRHLETPQSIFGLLSDVSVLQTLAYLTTILFAGWASPWLPIPLAFLTHGVVSGGPGQLQRLANIQLSGEAAHPQLIQLADLSLGLGATVLGITVLGFL